MTRLVTAASPSPGKSLDDLHARLVNESGSSQQGAFDQLMRADQLWWKRCREAVSADPAWLSTEQARFFREFINGFASLGDGAVADPAFVVAEALVPGVMQRPDGARALRDLTRSWYDCGLLVIERPPGAGLHSDRALSAAAGHLRDRLTALFRLLPQAGNDHGDMDGSRDDLDQWGAARTMVALTALLLAGLEPRRWPVVRVPIVFASDAPVGNGHEPGVAGILELQEFPSGPEGLFPDPRTMIGARSIGPEFAISLTHAWRATPWPGTGRCVLWRILLPDDPARVPRINGGSLGAPFAVGLRELFRRPVSRRPGMPWWRSLRATFLGLRPNAAVTGALNGTERLLRVGGLDEKLHVAHRKRWRLVAPKRNCEHIVSEADRKLVDCADTIREAERYARRWRVERLLTAAVVAVAVALSGVLVSSYETSASDRLQSASRLAAVSGTLLNTNVDLAQLFAVDAYRQNPDPQTRGALFRAVTSTPHLVRSLQADGQVSATGTSTDGRTVVAGTQTGSVVTWTLTGDGRPIREASRLKMSGAISGVAIAATAGTLAAMTATDVRIWSNEPTAGALSMPSGQYPAAVGVSPSGRFVVVATSAKGYEAPPELVVLDRATGRSTRVVLTDFGAPPSSIAFTDETQVVIFDGSYGTWQRLSLPALARVAGSTLEFGTHDYGSAISADGRYLSYTNGADLLPLWTTDGAPSFDDFSRTAQIHGEYPVALAVSNNATSIAQAITGTIYVSRSVPRGQAAPAPVTLTGGGPVTRDSLAFLGTSGDDLVSASGSLVNLWSITQLSRIARGADATIPASCDACSGPEIGLQPHGSGIAVVSGEDMSLDVWTADLGEQSKVEPPLAQPIYSPPLWAPRGNRVIVVDPQDDSAMILSATVGLPLVGSWPPLPNPLHLSDPAALLRLDPTGRRVIEVASSGTVKVRDASSGRLLRQVSGPRDMSRTADGSAGLPQGSVAVDPQASHAAVLDSAGQPAVKVFVTDIATGHVAVLDEPDAVGITYAGTDLLVQRRSGALDRWATDGSGRLGAIQGTGDTSVGPVSNGDTVVENTSDGSAQVIDYPSGYSLGALTLPAGIKATSTGIAFSFDGKTLVTATEAYGTGQVVEWQMDAGAWTKVACDAAGHDLTPAQWTQYVDASPPTSLRCGG